MSRQEINRMVADLIWIGMDEDTIGAMVRAAIEALTPYEAA